MTPLWYAGRTMAVHGISFLFGLGLLSLVLGNEGFSNPMRIFECVLALAVMYVLGMVAGAVARVR